MEFINIQTEQTTAVTDFILGVIALFIAFKFKSLRQHLFGIFIWRIIFILFAIGAFLGTLFHGLVLAQETKVVIWFTLLLSFVFVVSLFVIAMIYDLKGKESAKKLTPFILGFGVIVYLVMLGFSGKFIILIGYEVIAMLSALIGYIVGVLRYKTKDMLFMSLGILVTILASAVQALTDIVIEIGWVFDKNGVFHLIQIVGILFFYYTFKVRKWV